jgi:hypothetical protein
VTGINRSPTLARTGPNLTGVTSKAEKKILFSITLNGKISVYGVSAALVVHYKINWQTFP